MEQNGKLGFFVFLALFLLPLANAGVEIQSYSTSPSTVKPGMTGTITIVLNNPSATEFITAAYLNARAAGINFVSESKIGDLGAQGSTIVSIPFTVAQSATPGIAPITLELSYTSSISGGSNYKSFSIPLTIGSSNLLKVTNVRISQDTVAPGDSFIIEATIEDDGGPIKNAVLTYASTAAYTFDGTTKVEVGNLFIGEKKRISIPVVAGNSITSGYYSVPFTLTYDDAVTAGNTEILYFGPLTAVTDTAKFAATAETVGATPGGTGTFKIIVKNTGMNDLRNFKIALPQNSLFFTALDFTEKTIDIIRPDETKSLSFEVGIGTNIAAQVYSLPLTMTYETKSGSETVTKAVGVKIGGAPDLSVYISSNPSVITNDNKKYAVSIQISNTGNSPVRALSVSAFAEELEILSPPDSFIGTLSLDDYSTVQYDAVVKKGTAPGKYKLHVQLNYKDSYNTPIVEKKDVEFEIFPQEVALLAGKQNGTDPLVMIVLVVIVLIVIYFVYKRFFKSSASQKLKLK